MTNPTPSEHVAVHPNAGRCRHFYMVPEWPYVNRCTGRATQRVVIPAEGELDLCDTCAHDAEAYIARQDQS